MKKEQFEIGGMSCSACSAAVERAMNKLDGVAAVSVNLLTNSMDITFDESKLDAEKIIDKITDIGYTAALKKKNNAVKTADKAENTAESELVSMRKRLIVSIIFTLPLFYIAMGEMIGLPLPSFLTGMESAMVFGFTQFLLTLPVIAAGNRYFKVGLKNLIKRRPNMDTLIAVGSGAAFIYGIYAIYKISYALGHGDMETVHKFSMDLYFESSAMILTLITLGKYFEARAKSRTSDALTKLMNLAPKTAIIELGGKEQEIATDDVGLGDILIIKAGAIIPVDGEVVEGYSSVDESMITGESIPTEKGVGSKVIGGTINKSGYLKMKATAVGENTTLSKITLLVEEATSSKAPIAKLADKISGVFVPIVMLIALVTLIIWLIVGKSFEFSLATAISVLVISCPCALGLATPTAIMVGTGRGASDGILIKSAETLEVLHSVDTVVLDKTGTITEGKPEITDIIPVSAEENVLLSIAVSLERKSGHPLSEPIVALGKEKNITPLEIDDFELIEGGGIKGRLKQEDKLYYAGNEKLLHSLKISTEKFKNSDKYKDDGKTLLYFCSESELIGIIAVADKVKKESKAAVEKLHDMGIDVIMLTGDNKRTAESIKKTVGIKTVISEVLPADKEREVKRLQENGHIVAMVGDGINDAPALARADAGIAIGAGTEIAIESADVVLMKSELMDVPKAVLLSKAVMRNIKQNLFWAFIYNIIGIPIAAGVLYKAFGILLNPMIAAAAMSVSSVSVVLNALRLRFFGIK